jgi:large repetitive protein
VGATSATWRYDVSLPHTGNWTMGATAIDTAGQAALDNAAASWLIDPNAQAPTVSINAPAVMIPPTSSPTVQLSPGGSLTFSGGAQDDSDLANVEVALRNSTTRETLGSDGTWNVNNQSGWFRITGVNISGTTVNWSWTTPFTLKPGTYSFNVRATDDSGISTGSTNQGRLTLNVQVPGDNPPDTSISPTGTISGVLVRHLDLAGAATDDFGVSRVAVSLFENETGRYLQPNGTLAFGFTTIDATLGAGTTSRTWSLPVDLPANGNYSVAAYAYDTSNQQDLSTSGATSRYLVFPGDAAPTLVAALQSPAEGTAFTESRIVVSGRAEDDTNMSDVQIAISDSLGRYMSSNGSFTSTSVSYRSAFLTSPGSAGSNYSYTTPIIPNGAYTVTVRAVDIHGQTTPTPTVVHVTVSAPVNNQPPVAHATSSCTNGNNCSFDARTSTDENAPTLTYSWNFGNGRTGSGPLPTMYYQSAGTFTVTLTARDEYGLTASTTLTVTITTPPNNAAPVPVINPPACNVLVCNISGVGSADPNTGDSIRYLWDFGDGTATSTSSAPSHTFPAAGTYLVTLTVTDGWNVGATTTRSMTVG